MYEPKPVLERLADKVLVDDGCWEWVGAHHPEGYAQIKVEGRAQNAHRVVYELVIEDAIPDGLTLDHLCLNKGCVNPSHMEVVTRGENILRGDAPPAVNARKSVCKRGHPLDGDVYVTRDGRRDCRVCRRERRRVFSATAFAESEVR